MYTLLVVLAEEPVKTTNPVATAFCCSILIIIVVSAALYMMHRSGKTPDRLQQQYDRASALGKNAKRAVVPSKPIITTDVAAIQAARKALSGPEKHWQGGASADRVGRDWKVQIKSDSRLQVCTLRISATEHTIINGPVTTEAMIMDEDTAIRTALPHLKGHVNVSECRVSANSNGRNWVVTARYNQNTEFGVRAVINATTHSLVSIVNLQSIRK